METRLKCSETEEEKETVTVEKWTQLRYPGILRLQSSGTQNNKVPSPFVWHKRIVLNTVLFPGVTLVLTCDTCN